MVHMTQIYWNQTDVACYICSQRVQMHTQGQSLNQSSRDENKSLDWDSGGKGYQRESDSESLWSQGYCPLKGGWRIQGIGLELVRLSKTKLSNVQEDFWYL